MERYIRLYKIMYAECFKRLVKAAYSRSTDAILYYPTLQQQEGLHQGLINVQYEERTFCNEQRGVSLILFSVPGPYWLTGRDLYVSLCAAFPKRYASQHADSKARGMDHHAFISLIPIVHIVLYTTDWMSKYYSSLLFSYTGQSQQYGVFCELLGTWISKRELLYCSL